MDKVNWKKKLTSRKLWMAIASFVVMMMVYFGSPEESANQVASIIMAGATVIGYVIGEGLADSTSAAGSIEATTDADVDYPEGDED